MKIGTHDFKAITEMHGYEMWYDRQQALWTLTSEDKPTEYFTRKVLENMGIAKFDEYLLSINGESL